MIEKIILCRKREMPPGRRQDGFKALPPEALYDKLHGPMTSNHDWKILSYKGSYYVRTESFFPGDERVYELASCADARSHDHV
jgi:hypothetical protein